MLGFFLLKAHLIELRDQFPLMEVGRMTLDRNPENYFAEVEQLAFAPGHLVPGIELQPGGQNG